MNKGYEQQLIARFAEIGITARPEEAVFCQRMDAIVQAARQQGAEHVFLHGLPATGKSTLVKHYNWMGGGRKAIDVDPGSFEDIREEKRAKHMKNIAKLASELADTYDFVSVYPQVFDAHECNKYLRESEYKECHIYVMPSDDAHEQEILRRAESRAAAHHDGDPCHSEFLSGYKQNFETYMRDWFFNIFSDEYYVVEPSGVRGKLKLENMSVIVVDLDALKYLDFSPADEAGYVSSCWSDISYDIVKDHFDRVHLVVKGV